MNPKKKIDVEDLLSSYPAPPPPEDLVDRIRLEIPRLASVPTPTRRSRERHGWLKAAALVVLVAGAVYAGYRLIGNASPAAPPTAAQNLVPPVPPPPAVAPVISPGPPVPNAAAGEPSRLQPAKPPAAEAPRTAEVESQVVDQSGGPLPGATVTIRGEGASRTAVTDANGKARFPGLEGGRYLVEADLRGFGKRVDAVQVASGETKKLESTLNIVTTAEVTVAGATPLVDMKTAPSGSTGGVLGYYNDPNARADTRQLAPASSAPPAHEPSAAAPSTGGTAEPNDQPYGDVFFKAYGTNPFVDSDEDRFSTFGLDVDTGSYTVARRYLADGNLPPSEAIRVEEFLNAFDYGDPAPAQGDFAITASGGPSPYPRASDRYRVVRFGLRARDVDPRDRKPATLVFVVDVSGSMKRENRLGLVQQALGLLLGRLRPFDRVGLVVFGTDARAILEPTGDHEAIRRAIEQLVAEGATNAEAGLQVGYDMAERHHRNGEINRVILCSDGVANVGRTGPDSILAVIERQAKAGIELTTVGFGMGNYNDVLMEQLADKGNGHYAYVDTLQEARRVFVENLTGTLQTVAVDSKVQVEFDPLVVSRYRLLGYENRDIADEKFRDDKVDAGEIGAGHQVSAVYEIKLADGARSGEAATLRLRYRPADGKDFIETERTLRLEEFAKSWDRSPRSLRQAALVVQLAEVLKESYWARGVDISRLAGQLRTLARETPGDARLAEVAEIAERAAALRARKASQNAPED